MAHQTTEAIFYDGVNTQRKTKKFHIFDDVGVAEAEIFFFFKLGSTEIWTWISGAEVQRSNQYTMELPDKQGYA